MLRSSFLFLAVAIASAACAADQGDKSIILLRNQAPQNGCVISADLSGAGLSSGVMDLYAWPAGHATFGYTLTPLIENLATADVANLDLVRRRTALLQGAHVDISFNSNAFMTDSDQSALDQAGLLHFDSRFAGAVEPNQGTAAVSFQIVPAAVFDAIKVKYQALEGQMNVSIPSVDMVVKVVLYGMQNDGAFEAEPFEYPVTACDGCLTVTHGLCSSLLNTFMSRTGGACYVPQDGVVDCCIDDTTMTPVCPAVGTNTGA
jgi:hypothetical protein